MNFQNLLENSIDTFKNTSPAGRVGIAFILLLIVGIVIVVGYWAQTPNYVALADGLDASTSAQIIGKIEAAGIQTTTSYNGSTVLVPSVDLGRARLAAKDVLGPEISSGSSSSFIPNPGDSKRNAIKEKEDAISRSIEQMKFVRSASVILSMPKRSAIFPKQTASKASVNLNLFETGTVGAREIESIRELVVGAVDNLQPKDVMIVDQFGTAYNRSTGSIPQIEEQAATRQSFELELARKAERQLEKILGKDRAQVTVYAQIDFDRVSGKSTNNEEGAIIRDEFDRTKSIDDGKTGGPAGTQSNLGQIQSGKAASRLGNQTGSATIEYAPSVTSEQYEYAPGSILWLSVSAVVDTSPHPPEPDPNADPNDPNTQPPAVDPNAPPLLSQEDVESIIKAAVGFDKLRQDELDVVIAKIHSPKLAGGSEAESSEATQAFYIDLAKNTSLGIAAVIAGIFGFLLIWRIKPIQIESQPAGTEMTPERARHFSEMARIAEQNPELIQKVMAAFMNEPTSSNQSRAA